MAKKTVKKSSKKDFHESNLKAVLAFAVVALAAIIFAYVNSRKEELIAANLMDQVVWLVAAGFAFLIALVLLANRSQGSKRKK